MKGWFSENGLRRSLCLFMLTILSITLGSAMAYASGGGGEEGGSKALWIDFIWRMVNFSILVWFLYWVSANKIKEFFSGRRKNIKDALAEAIAKKEEAEKRFKEYSEKLERATEEITTIIETIKNQGLLEKEKIIEDAKKAAEKIKEDAQLRIEQESNAAVNRLRKEAIELSIQMAEGILKKQITPQHHEYMVKDYIDEVVKKH
jgi:F-type H+-transporting ATPase subunit b